MGLPEGLGLSLLMVFVLQGTGVLNLSLNNCTNGQITVVENKLTPITCNSIWYDYNAYWYIRRPRAVETIISNCLRYQNQCSGSNQSNYNVSGTRYGPYGGYHSSTLRFLAGFSVSDDGATIRCSTGYYNATCTLRVLKEYRLDNCVNNRVRVVYRNRSTLRCSGLAPSQSMKWTISNHGASVTCEACSATSCPPCHSNRHGLSSYRHADSSYLLMEGLAELTRGNLTCSEQSGLTQDNCYIDVEYYLPRCTHEGLLEIRETQSTNTPISCEGLLYNENMNWTLTDTGSTKETLVAFCRSLSHNSYQCDHVATGFKAKRNNSVSELRLTNDPRTSLSGKILTCVRRDTYRRTECRVRVVYPAEVSPQKVTLTNWNLTGLASVSKVFDSENNVTCVWTVTGPSTNDVFLTSRPPELSPFEEEEAGGGRKMYYSGRCFLEIRLDGTEGEYGMSVMVLPGGSTVDLGTVIVAKPGPLISPEEHCPAFAAEGSDITCQCRHVATKSGSPPALVTWLNDVSSDTLRLRNVGRTLNGSEFTCLSQWGPPGLVTSQTANYRLRVAYGPSKASMSRHKAVVNGTSLITFACQVEDVYPAVRFNWSVPCLTLHSTPEVSNCTVRPEMTSGLANVACLAFNSEFPAMLSVETSLAYEGRVSDNGASYVTPIVGAAVGVVVAAVAGVVVVVVLKRRKSQKHANKESGDAREDEVVEYVNDLYGSGLDEASPPGPPNNPPPADTAPTTASAGSRAAEPEASSLNVNTGAAAVASTGDVYAQVMKKPKKPPKPPTVQTQKPPEKQKPPGQYANTVPEPDVYAQVNKPKKKGAKPVPAKRGKNPPVQPEAEAGNEVDLYANCPSSATGESSEIYMNVPQSSDQDPHTNEIAAPNSDEDYNHLQFNRMAETLPDVDSHYNHLEDV